MRKTGEKKTSLHSSIIGSQTKEELAEEKKRLAGEITNKKQPLLIYIAESDHADATYGSLAEQLINESKKSGLKIQVFSEFSSQDEKIRTQREFKNKTDEASFQRTTELLRAPNIIEMGSLQEREKGKDELFKMLKGKKPSELKQLGLEKGIDSPELRDLFRKELEEEIENGDNPLNDKKDFKWWLGGFYSRVTHERMANDVRNSLDPESDVVVIIAGSPHVPSLGELLKTSFPDSTPTIITKPSGQTNFPVILTDSTNEALARVGKVTGFEADSGNKAVVPDEVGHGISARSKVRYPHNLSAIVEANSQSSADEKNREGWIMSVSKSFCGATAALMAADGKFGKKGVDVTLNEMLQIAREHHPEREAEIKKYEDAIKTKDGLGNVTMAQLLSHRNGLIQQGSYFTNDPQFVGDNPGLIASDHVKFMPKKVGTTFSYGNPTFMLAEDLMGLASDLGSYEKELKERITKPLNLTHTRRATDRGVASDVVKIAGVVDYDTYDLAPAKKTSRSNPFAHSQTGEIPLSAGGLCSSVADLEKFSAELAKMICGMPSDLVQDEDKARRIHQSYLSAFEAGEKCVKDAGSSDDANHYAQNYSLGIIIESVNSEGKLVEGHSNDKDRLRIRHIGNFAGNDSSMSATMPCSLNLFRSGDSANMRGITPEVDSLITQNDVITKHFLLTMPGHDYAKRMDDYFLGKSRADSEFVTPDKTDGKCWRRYWQHLDLAQGRDKNIQAWQDELIAEGKLPKNFAEYHEEILEAYRPAHKALHDYLVENFLDKETGVIDRKKIADTFKDAAAFEELRKEVLEPHLNEAHKKTEEIFARSEAALVGKQTKEGGFVEMVTKNRKEEESGKSWVERTATSQDNPGRVP